MSTDNTVIENTSTSAYEKIIEDLRLKLLRSEEESTQIIIKLDKRISEVRSKLEICQSEKDALVEQNLNLTTELEKTKQEMNDVIQKFTDLSKTQEEVQSTEQSHLSTEVEIKYYVEECLKYKKERDAMEIELNEAKQLCLELVEKLKKKYNVST